MRLIFCWVLTILTGLGLIYAANSLFTGVGLSASLAVALGVFSWLMMGITNAAFDNWPIDLKSYGFFQFVATVIAGIIFGLVWLVSLVV